MLNQLRHAVKRSSSARFASRAASTTPDGDEEKTRQRKKAEDAGKIFVFWAFMEWNFGYPLINGVRALLYLPPIGKPPPVHDDGIKSKYKWEHNEN